MRTKAELSTDTLRQMGILNAIEDATAEDAALAEGVYDAKLAEWRRLGLVWWTNTNRNTAEIPDEVYGILGDLLENELNQPFGMSGSPSGPQKREAEKVLLLDLRALNHKPPSGEATPFSIF